MFVNVVVDSFPFDDRYLELPWTADLPGRLVGTIKGTWDTCVEINLRHYEPCPCMTDDIGCGNRLNETAYQSLPGKLTSYDTTRAQDTWIIAVTSTHAGLCLVYASYKPRPPKIFRG